MIMISYISILVLLLFYLCKSLKSLVYLSSCAGTVKLSNVTVLTKRGDPSKWFSLVMFSGG